MKKAISLVLAALMVSPTVSPAFSQNLSAPKGTKKGAVEESTLVGPVSKKQDPTAETTLVAKGSKKQPTGAVTGSTTFGAVTAYSDGSGVWLSWTMEAEVGNICFYVYRVGKGGAELLSPNKQISGAAIHGREIPQYGQTYQFFDANGRYDSAYYIEALSLSGQKTRTAQFYAQYVSDLGAATNLSRTDIEQRGVTDSAVLEKSLLSFSKEIITESEETTLAPDPVMHRTVISQPGVARIGVKGEGLVRVTSAQLTSAGFDTGTDSSMWQLYVEGIEQPMIIGPGYIEFYGKGTDTVETDIRKYYLVNGSTPGKRIESRVAHTNTSTVVTPSYSQTFVKKERNNFVDDVINGDAENYWGRGFGSALSTLNFTMTGVDFNSPNATINLRFQGYSATVHSVEVTLNDQVLGTIPGAEGEVPFSGGFPIPTSLLREGANTVKFRSIATAADFSFFDSVYVSYNRKYLADSNSLFFYTQNYRIAKLDGFTSPNVRVFDITRDGEPALMTNLTFQQNGATFGTNMPAARGRSFYAVEDSAILAPESVTANNPELVGIPTNGADLVIISYKDLLPQAQAWADYRASQGVSVKVIEVSELYDEFNYGALSSGSIKSFLQYAYTSWANPPKYVMLVGDASWDSRNYEGLGNWNFVPPKFVSTSYTDTASDEALADFNNDGLSEIAIGRIAARTGAQVTTMLNKTILWETLPHNWPDRGALFAYDFDNGYPFSVMSTNLRNQIPGVPATFVFRGETNANSNLLTAMSSGPDGGGRFIINYSGHGTAGSWGGSPLFFNVFSVPTVADHNPSIFTMLTCLNGFFHWLYNPSFAEVLTTTPNKGAVVAWASTGLTTPDLQEDMATRFYQKLNEGSIPRMGDLVKDAKTAVNGGTDVRLCWALIGDPMLKVR